MGKLFVTAVDWDELRRAPIRLDWTAMEIDARSADEILAMLEGPRPVVPQRVHHLPDIGMWDGSLRPPGLISVLQTLNMKDQRSLRALAVALSGSARLLSGRDCLRRSAPMATFQLRLTRRRTMFFSLPLKVWLRVCWAMQRAGNHKRTIKFCAA